MSVKILQFKPLKESCERESNLIQICGMLEPEYCDTKIISSIVINTVLFWNQHKVKYVVIRLLS